MTPRPKKRGKRRGKKKRKKGGALSGYRYVAAGVRLRTTVRERCDGALSGLIPTPGGGMGGGMGRWGGRSSMDDKKRQNFSGCGRTRPSSLLGSVVLSNRGVSPVKETVVQGTEGDRSEEKPNAHNHVVADIDPKKNQKKHKPNL